MILNGKTSRVVTVLVAVAIYGVGCTLVPTPNLPTPTTGIHTPAKESGGEDPTLEVPYDLTPTHSIPTPTRESDREEPTLEAPGDPTPTHSIPTPTRESEREEPTSEVSGGPAPTPSRITLPVKRQVAPSDIQAQARWFDGGASGGDDCVYRIACILEQSSSIEVVQSGQKNGLLYEGKPVVVCMKDLPPQSQFTWVLHTPDGDSITDTASSSSTGYAEICLHFGYLRGSYKFHAVSGGTLLETQFEMLPAESPRIWTVGRLEPGATLSVHYAGFESREEITTVWYSASDWRADYLTSWQTMIDDSGRGTETVYAPQDMCIPEYSILAAHGHKIVDKGWGILGRGFWLDLAATAIAEVYADTNCATEKIHYDQLIDNSSRVLEQVDMGTIGDGETKFGTLGSIFDAHNWVFEATERQPVSIRVTYLHNDFPVHRVSIVDPSGGLVYECSDVLRGCWLDNIKYTPSTSGSFIVRIDMFGHGDGAYSISLNSLRDVNINKPFEIVIDDSSDALALSGPSSSWRIAPFGYDGSTHWTYCTDEGVSNSARWTPQLPAGGNYEVFVFIPARYAGTARARYIVHHNRMNSEVLVRQADYSNEWVSIGTYWFMGDGTDFVYLDDNTGEPLSLGVTIGFDAVKFVYTP